MRSLLRAVLVVIAAASLAGVTASAAHAQAKRDVAIETDPAGADVYLNSKDDGSACKTPCTIKAPIGETILIIELENHLPLMEQLVVPKRGKAAPTKFKLTRAVGTVIVKGPQGAQISIGDDAKGRAPSRIEVDAGPHTITLTLGGKQVHQDLIEVEANGEITVRGPEVAASGPEDDGEVLDIEDGDPEPRVEKPAAGPRRGAFLAVGALVDIGFRSFAYSGVDSASMDALREEKESGQVMAGPVIELWPGNLAGIPALRGLSLLARLQLPVNKQTVTGGGLGDTATTFWQSFEISARHRWTIASRGTVEVGAGYVRDQHQFNTQSAADLALLPDADYQSVRIGVRGSLLLGSIEPYLVGENRIVMSGGKALEERFSLGGSASGLRGALGIAADLGPLVARLEGSYTRYSWTFKAGANDMLKADGATDAISMLSMALAYEY